MFSTIYTVTALVALCAILVLAIWRGGSAEKAAAGFVAAGWALSTIAQSVVYSYVPFVLASDALVLACLCWVAWRSQREWSVVAAACQGVGVATSAFYLSDYSIPPTIYVTAVFIVSYSVLAAIGWGVAAAAAPRPSNPLLDHTSASAA